jgi:[acyl-carrier-protein] S-malonyltransferase
MLGHSVGEYSALCASDCLTFPDALRLVKWRGQAMRDATAKSATRTVMAALEPCSPTLALKLCAAAEKETGGVCALACDNSDWQQVISGDERAVRAAMEMMKTGAFAQADDAARGGKQQQQQQGPARAVLLEVSGAFHSPCMKPAQEAMREDILSVKMQRPSVPIICNVTGLPTRNTDFIRQQLLTQLTGTVQWRASIRFCQRTIMHSWTEIGPAAVLTPMLKRHFLPDDSVRLQTVTNLAELQQCIKHDADRKLF